MSDTLHELAKRYAGARDALLVAATHRPMQPARFAAAQAAFDRAAGSLLLEAERLYARERT